MLKYLNIIIDIKTLSLIYYSYHFCKKATVNFLSIYSNKLLLFIKYKILVIKNIKKKKK